MSDLNPDASTLAIPPRTEDLTGMTFYRLKVVSYAGKKQNRSYWNCVCECGNQKKVRSDSLKNGMIRSCRCLHFDIVATRNGLYESNKREYESWRKMIDRCTNPEHKYWQDYGGRGITVCTEWLDSFQQFLQDMGKRPQGTSIERIDNSKGYSKENCKWATAKEQARNRRSNHLIEFEGRTLLLTEWAEIKGIESLTLLARIRRGWSIEKSLITPVKNKGSSCE